jgi:hypothetical protein
MHRPDSYAPALDRLDRQARKQGHLPEDVQLGRLGAETLLKTKGLLDTKPMPPLTANVVKEEMKGEVGRKLRELRGSRAANDMSSVMGGGTQTLLDAEKRRSWLGWEKVEKLLLFYKPCDADWEYFSKVYSLAA